MISLLSSLSGCLISLMNLCNSQLSRTYGPYLSTVMIHAVGLLSFLLILMIYKHKIKFDPHINPIYYLGGAIGVMTVLLCSSSILVLGTALVTALGLLGQLLFSLLLEKTGWLHTAKNQMTLQKGLGLGLVIVGIGVMLC